MNGIRFTSDIIYDDKCIKTKVKTLGNSTTLFNDKYTPPRKNRICLHSMY